MKKSFLILLIVFLSSHAFAGKPEKTAQNITQTQTGASSYSSAKTEVKSNYVSSLALPYVSNMEAPQGDYFYIVMPWDEIPVSAIEPTFWENFWGFFSWGNYQISVIHSEKTNRTPIRFLDSCPDKKNQILIGQVRAENWANKAPLQVIKEALWEAKKATNTSYVLLVGRDMKVAKGSNRGIGPSFVTSMFSSDSSSVTTAGGAGIIGSAEAASWTGLELFIYCYSDPIIETTADCSAIENLKNLLKED
jgi:hypothetical protein